MKTTFVSTHTLANATRRSVIQMQAELTNLQKEVSTGRAADVGLALGARTGSTVGLRKEMASLQTLVDSNAVAGSRLSTTQAILGEISADAQTFLGILIDSRTDPGSAVVTVAHAKEQLAALIGKLNSAQNGEYLFGGFNTDVKPVGDYVDGSPAKQAVATAFQARFGFEPGDPAASTITAAAMQNFLDTDFATLFDGPAWRANWSTASDQSVSSRISTSETVQTGTTANDPAIRKFAMAITMVADLGLAGLSDAAYGAIMGKATELLGSAMQGVTSTQAQLGYSQQAIVDASERMSIQGDVLEKHIGELEGIDPYEASTRITTLLTQIETSYALTARIQKLSLIDFI